MRDGRASGRTPAEIRATLDAARLGAPFAGGNPVFQYYFEQYFLGPNVARTFDELAAAQP